MGDTKCSASPRNHLLHHARASRTREPHDLSRRDVSVPRRVKQPHADRKRLHRPGVLGQWQSRKPGRREQNQMTDMLRVFGGVLAWNIWAYNDGAARRRVMLVARYCIKCAVFGEGEGQTDQKDIRPKNGRRARIYRHLSPLLRLIHPGEG